MNEWFRRPHPFDGIVLYTSERIVQDQARFPLERYAGSTATKMAAAIDRILKRLGEFERTLVSHSIGSLLVNATAHGANFVLAIVLARALGVERFGAYSLALAWVLVLGIPAGLGMNRMLMREVAALKEQGLWSKILAMIHWSRRTTLLVAGATAGLTALVVWGLVPAGSTRPVLLLALLLLPVNALLYLHQGIVVGAGRSVAGQTPGAMVQPVLFLALAVGLWWQGWMQEATTAIWGNIGTSIIALLFAMLLVRRILPPGIRTGPPAPGHATVLLKSALALTLLGGLTLLNSRLDTIMLGLLTDTRNVGLFSVASRGAQLVGFAAFPVQAVVGPELSRLHTTRDRAGLQRAASQAARLVLLVALPVAVALGLYGSFFLRLFGPEFVQVEGPLRVLVAGQLVLALTGPGLLLLITIRAERTALLCAIIGTLVNIVGNLLLIPLYGTLGAAMATTTSLAVWSVIAARASFTRAGINTTALVRLSSQGAGTH